MFSTAAFAATITVQNVIDGETYDAYKILNYTNNNSAYSYYLTTAQYNSGLGSLLEAAGFSFTQSSDGTQYYVDNASTFDAAAAAAYLGAHETDVASYALAHDDTEAASGSATFSGLGTGYYFVTSSAGSLCALTHEDDLATAVEKNTIPEVDKTEKNLTLDASGNYTDGPVDANIGDTIGYQIVVTDGIGTDAQLTLTDTMGAGLTYTPSSITIDGSSVADNANTANYTVSVSGQTITIVFSAAYVASKDTGDSITVTYSATLNENAVVDDDDADANKNYVHMQYSAQEDEDQVYVETYDFTVYKTDGTNFLDGAEFKLYDAATGGNEITLTSDGNGGYYPSSSGTDTIDINSSSGCNVYGLAPGTYYLEEVATPAGYNPLSARESVTITSGQTQAVEKTVVNNAGAELPSTGGIGTVIFYVVGAILVLGAGILLVARRRSAVTEQ